MASYPGGKVHRHNRRKLGRGQVPPLPMTAITVASPSADVMKIVAASPVVWASSIAATVVGLTIVSQHVVSSTEVDITFSGAVTGLAWTVPAGAGVNFQGGGTAAGSGTF